MDIIEQQGGIEKYKAKNFTADDFDTLEQKKGSSRPVVQDSEDDNDGHGVSPYARQQDAFATEKKQ